MEKWENWVQQSFEFVWDEVPSNPPAVPKRKNKRVDYKLLYESLKQGPLTFTQIGQLAGIENRNSISQVITTLSLHYPIYEADRGIYKLYGDDDYGDGINHSVLKEINSEWED